jgi:excisionase family DNA binding protein
MNLERFISQAEAAKLRGVSKQAIANLIRRGRLSSVVVAGRTLLDREEVENFVAQPKLGRPPKRKSQKRRAQDSKVKQSKK